MSSTGRPEPQDRGPLGRFGAPVGQGGQRPPHVLVATVAGFLEAGLLALAALAYFLASVREPSFVLFGAVFLGLFLACVLGSVQVLRGRNRAVLMVAGSVAAAIALVLIAISVASGAGFDAFSALVVLLGVAAVVLLLQAPSRDWFAAHRGR